MLKKKKNHNAGAVAPDRHFYQVLKIEDFHGTLVHTEWPSFKKFIPMRLSRES